MRPHDEMRAWGRGEDHVAVVTMWRLARRPQCPPAPRPRGIVPQQTQWALPLWFDGVRVSTLISRP